MNNINTGDKDIDSFLETIAQLDLKDKKVEYNGSKLILKTDVEFSQLKETTEKIFDDVNTLLSDTLEIRLSSCKMHKTSIFYKTEDFLQKYEKIKEDFVLQTIIIITADGDYLLKKPNATYNQINKAIFNIHEYKQILLFFLNTPEFTPYVSETDDQFTLISKTHGVFNIGYQLPKVSFFQEVDLNNLFNRFQKEFKKKEFIQFFKEVLITGVHNTEEENRFNKIIKEHNTLLNLAKRDYEIYVSNFAFDKVKSEFKEERGMYFDSIDKNIASIGKQVISFPLTFGATIFASYKVKDQPALLILILSAYFLYTIIAFLVLNMTAYNIKCLRKDVKQEEEIIQNSYRIIYADFKNDFKKIKHKITNLRIIIGFLYFILISLLSLFIIFTLHQINILDLSDLLSSS